MLCVCVLYRLQTEVHAEVSSVSASTAADMLTVGISPHSVTYSIPADALHGVLSLVIETHTPAGVAVSGFAWNAGASSIAGLPGGLRGRVGVGVSLMGRCGAEEACAQSLMLSLFFLDDNAFKVRSRIVLSGVCIECEYPSPSRACS